VPYLATERRILGVQRVTSNIQRCVLGSAQLASPAYRRATNRGRGGLRAGPAVTGRALMDPLIVWRRLRRSESTAAAVRLSVRLGRDHFGRHTVVLLVQVVSDVLSNCRRRSTPVLPMHARCGSDFPPLSFLVPRAKWLAV